MKIYLDTCYLNRPFDDQTQDRIRLEAEAILLILDHFETGKWQWVSSEVVDFEIERIPDRERRHRVATLSAFAREVLTMELAEVERAQQLQELGFHSFDAMHLACAENGGADLFLTTDDGLCRLAGRLLDSLQVRVENPLK